MREKDDYRHILLRLKEFFPDKEVLNKNDVANYTGLDKRTVAKRYEFTNNLISIVKLARLLS